MITGTKPSRSKKVSAETPPVDRSGAQPAATLDRPSLRSAVRRFAGEIDVPVATSPTVDVELEKIVRHPKNRRPRAAAVAKVAASMADVGQIDDVLLRLHPQLANRYELVSGEHRQLAAQSLGWRTVRAKVKTLDDRQTLLIVAAANAARTDLDPIERAELLAELVKPIEEGGAGLTHEEAGKVFPNAKGEPMSRPAVSNALRLLVLPATVRDLVSEGDLPETFVRPLLPLFDSPAGRSGPGPLAKEAESAIVKLANQAPFGNRRPKDADPAEGATAVWSREQFAQQVARAVTENYPSVDEKRGSWIASSEWNLNDIVKSKGKGSQAFNLTQANREELRLVDVGGRTVATNVEAYRRCNLDAAKDLLEKLKKKSSSGKAGGSKGAAAPAKSEAERAKEAALRLTSRLEDLAADFRCYAASREVEREPTIAAVAAVWFLSSAGRVAPLYEDRVCAALLGETRDHRSDPCEQYAEETGAAASLDRERALLAKLLYEPGGKGHLPATEVAVAVLKATGEADEALDDAWRLDRGTEDARHLTAYLAAHDTEPLRKLLTKCGLKPSPKDKKGELLKLGVEDATSIPLPPEYRLAAPKGSKKGAAKR